MNNPFIEEVTASGEEILNIVEAIEPILSKVPRAQACMACLATAISMMNPNLTARELQEGVKGASEWVCTYVTGIEMGSVPLGKMH